MGKRYRVLNLYACLGGNRLKWDEVAREAGYELEVVAVEMDAELSVLYRERFPNDIVVEADAHQYLLDHYREFDFIWSSPPCPSHSRARFARASSTESIYPDLKLYEEVIFLDNYFEGKYCVEYEPKGKMLFITFENKLNENPLPGYQVCYKSNKECKYNCDGLCKESC